MSMEPDRPNHAPRAYWVGLAASFLLPLAVYVYSAAPVVTLNDAGELAGAAATLGIPHPSGYPLFVLLGHLWCRLFAMFTPIYALNLFAAFCAAAAAALFFDTARLVLRLVFGDTPRQHWAAFAAAMLFALSRGVWEQGVCAEVYPLHLLLLVLSIRLFLGAVHAEPPSAKRFIAWAFFLGLAFSNHITTFMLAPGMLYFYFMRMGFRGKSWRTIGIMIPPFLLPLLLYAFMPWRSAGCFPFHGRPDFDWGGTGSSLYWFIYHVTGRQYRAAMFSTAFVPQVHTFLVVFLQQFALFGLIPFLTGLVVLFRRNGRLALFLLLLAAGCLAYAFTYTIPDIENYFLLAFTAFFLFTAAGMLALMRWKRFWVGAILLMPLIAFPLNYPLCTERGDYRVNDYVRCIGDHLEPNAILITGQWEQVTSPFWYLQRAEQYRPDVMLVEWHLLRREWYIEQLDRWYPEPMAKAARERDELMARIRQYDKTDTWDQDGIRAEAAFVTALLRANLDERPAYMTLDVPRNLKEAAPGMTSVPEGAGAALFPGTGPPRSR